MTRPPNPNMIAAMELFGDDPEVARLQVQVWELSQRVEDLAAYVHAHVQTEPEVDQPGPVADVLALHYGVCDHGRLLRDPCPDCQRRTS